MIEVFNKEINVSIERFVIIPLIASPGILKGPGEQENSLNVR